MDLRKSDLLCDSKELAFEFEHWFRIQGKFEGKPFRPASVSIGEGYLDSLFYSFPIATCFMIPRE